jgi:hypothetical protein
LIEAEVGIDARVLVTEDERRNERACYERLFSNECRAFVEVFYSDMTNRMKHGSYGEAAGPLFVLAFLQEIVATALWKYDLDVGEELTQFAREFDRLDVETERVRLYERAVRNKNN